MKREIPLAPLSLAYRMDNGLKLYPNRPITPLEALMGCAPGDEPDRSVVEMLDLRDVIEDAIHRLEPLEMWVLNEVVVGRASLRSLGLPKTTVARIRDKALDKLRRRLENDPIVKTFLVKEPKEKQ